MSLTIHPSTVEGAVAAPPSKSVTHRALFLGLSGRGGTVHDPLWSKDTLASLRAVQALGCKAVATQTEAVLGAPQRQAATIDAANSGTTLRLATALAALSPGTSRLSGDTSLNQRPMGPLVDALTQLGAEATCLGEDGRPPVELTGPITGDAAKLPGDVSSQFISALLLAAPNLPDGLTLELTTPLRSAPYVDLTIRMLQEAGVQVEGTQNAFVVDPQPLEPVRVHVPGDYSGAAFPLVTGAITGSAITVTNLPPDSGQGDEAVVEILEGFGVEIQRERDTLAVQSTSLTPAKVDLADNPDLFPPLAVLAACCPGTSTFHGAPHLKDKESDRIAAMVDGLTALGIDAQAHDDGATITGGPIASGTVESHGDHRIQMAFAIAGLVADGPVTIQGPDDAHAVSYPAFLQQLTHLGAKLERSQEATS